ncbi:MAG: Hsp70 family protein [Candidatus Obscuribacter sp.]|nr:Hsp70 family protein [Candidatus Obscuribacter sp.]
MVVPRIPAVKELVKSPTGGKDPNQSVNPDEVVAIVQQYMLVSSAAK